MPNCLKYEERDKYIKYYMLPNKSNQSDDTHSKGLEICQITTLDQNKADCLIIMRMSLRISGVKTLIKDFARAVHGRKGYVILVNTTDIVTKEWNEFIDYQIEGTCNEWVNLVDIELLEIKKITSKNKLKNKSNLDNTSDKKQVGKKRKTE
ncbi:13343_t:CDS:2 [Dentiscutata heterogama]|uniref:13343_t:CDS:1 n=1 Tax=Dentiscutata heterogama TaxID=1316150 RepID=A0ACA9KWU9_9GLOM|nr:13343_t:CDS:2 [Dentiscutata heterogama]